MSEKLGPLTYGKKEEQIFLGREIAQHKDYSEETAQRIDKEVTRLVSDSYEKAKKLLSDHIDILNRIASGLLEKEVLNTTELDEIIQMNREDVAGSGDTIPRENQTSH